jgi:hypothetical protein
MIFNMEKLSQLDDNLWWIPEPSLGSSQDLRRKQEKEDHGPTETVPDPACVSTENLTVATFSVSPLA